LLNFSCRLIAEDASPSATQYVVLNLDEIFTAQQFG